MNPVISIPESVHAILSASKSATWLTCAGALAAAKDKPPRPSSKYAAEGTVYHDVARRALQGTPTGPEPEAEAGWDCTHYIGARYEVQGFTFTVDEANAIEAQKYVDLVRSWPGKRMIEVDVDYSALLGLPKVHKPTGQPIAAGSSDAVVLDYDNHVVYVADLKFGRGDIVYALKNSQMRLYAAGAIARYRLLGIEDDWLVKMVIAQPRANHFDEETLTVAELMAWVEQQKARAQRAYALWLGSALPQLSPADFVPTDKACRWCPLSGNCDAQNRKVLDQFPTGHATAAIPNLVTLDDTQLAMALDSTDEIEHWMSAVRAEGLARALQGHTLPNWKVVQGRRGNRALTEGARVTLDEATAKAIGIEDVEAAITLPVEDAIHFAMGDAAYKPRELKSISQLQKPMEKKAPEVWAALQACVTQPDGKPSLERIEDPRPPMTVVSSEFPIAPTAGGII